jgi:nucleoid-associated protein EbfC
VLGERDRVRLRAELFEQQRRPLDVGEHEGDGPAGKVAHRHSIPRDSPASKRADGLRRSIWRNLTRAHKPMREADSVSMDMNKMLQQVQQMQEQMAKAQEELAHETVEASVGGGMVVVKANGSGEIIDIKISPEAIDPDDPEGLADLVLAGVNEALRNAQELVQSKLGGAMGGLKGLGLPGL